MINIITLKINEMKNLPDLTQCQENLYCIYRCQVERPGIHSAKHSYSFFSTLPLISSQPRLFTRLLGRKLLIFGADTVITKGNTWKSVHQPSLKHSASLKHCIPKAFSILKALLHASPATVPERVNLLLKHFQSIYIVNRQTEWIKWICKHLLVVLVKRCSRIRVQSLAFMSRAKFPRSVFTFQQLIKLLDSVIQSASQNPHWYN